MRQQYEHAYAYELRPYHMRMRVSMRQQYEHAYAYDLTLYRYAYAYE